MELEDIVVPEDTDSVKEETKIEEQQEVEESVETMVKPKRTRRRRKTQATTSKTMRTKTCKVVQYNQKAKTLDIDFDGYGIRLKGVKGITSNEVVVKYKGEIGKPDFQCELG